MMNIANFATAAFAPVIGMPISAFANLDGRDVRTRDYAAAKCIPGTLVWSPPTR